VSGKTPQQQYDEWRETPHGEEVYRTAVMVVAELRMNGRLTKSARELVHEMRYRCPDPQGRDKDGYKVSNTMSPYLGDELEDNGIVPVGWFTRHRKFREGVADKCEVQNEQTSFF
jgi:hypothetical protein